MTHLNISEQSSQVSDCITNKIKMTKTITLAKHGIIWNKKNTKKKILHSAILLNSFYASVERKRGRKRPNEEGGGNSGRQTL